MHKTYEILTEFNGIILLESLAKGELKTGTNLFETTIKPKCYEKNLTCAFHAFYTKKELFGLLKGILAKCEDPSINLMPILQIDCHGSVNGLQVSSSEIVKWEELEFYLRNINIACANRLVVILSACQSYHAITTIDSISKPSPYFALIGSIKKLKAGELEESLKRFYNDLLENFDLSKGKNIMGDNYRMFLCEKVFAISILEYINKYSRGKSRRQRLESLLSEVIETLEKVSTKRDLKNLRDYIRTRIKPEQFPFIVYRDHFLMADNPRNKNRFNLTIEELLEASEKLI